MDNLFEQISNISKAHGYDILREQISELKKENQFLKDILIDIRFDLGVLGELREETKQKINSTTGMI